MQAINVVILHTFASIMARKRFFFGLITALSITGLLGFAVYDDPISKIIQQLNKWANERPVEKVYLHLDKPYYAAGDDIWFKAYVTGGSQNKLTTISGILNVELIDGRDSIKQSVKLPLKGGVAAGDFALPDTLYQGGYRIRAYTNYMRNAGSEYFFDKAITIINNTLSSNAKSADKITVRKASYTDASPGKADVQFFPESGSLVGGIATKVAFKAVSVDGSGIDVKGVINDNTGKQIAQFASTHLGMGVFDITPVYGNIYTAKITNADGSINIVPLPKVLNNGYVLSITDTDAQNLQVKISASKNLLNRDAGIILIAQSQGKVYYSEKTKPGSITIPKSKFPAGIIQFTLFSAGGEPLNERLVFVQHPEKLKLTLLADRQTYSARQKVKINVDANSNGKPAIGNFSVSIIDETKLPFNEADENNIVANLLLTADLKGYVEQPAYYFNKINDKTRADLDMLMLTQGYRRFEWKEILNDRLAPNVYQPESSLRVSGTVTNLSGKPVANGKVKLIDLDNIDYTLDTITDARGRFAFTNMTFEDSVRFIVQARTDKNKKDVMIQLDSIAPANTAGKTNVSYEVSVGNDLSVYAQSSKELYQAQMRYGVGNHVIPLREVIIREKKQALKYSSNLNGPGNADQILLARDLQDLGCIVIANCLQGRLLGVVFRNGIPYSTRSYNRPMQVIIDGAYVEPSFLNNVNYNDVQAIEVLRNAGTVGIYGGRGGNGVIIVTTKRGDENEYTGPITGRGIKVLYPKGYLKARTFYSPQYDKSGVNKQLADLRTTIFWKPDVLTGSNGKTSFEYFNAGSKGNYRVVIEGIDKDGNIGRQVYKYKVE
jgi:TonB-dependent SusC/RagA subfamily outer membrane receptor